MNELLTKIGVGEEQLAQYGPAVVGGVAMLAALVVGRFAAVRTWRGAKALRRWWAKPPVPPAEGTDAWIVAELTKLMTPEQDQHWTHDGGDYYSTTLSTGMRVQVTPDTSKSVGVRIDGLDKTSSVREIPSRALRRAHRKLCKRFEAARAAEAGKVFHDLAREALANVSAPKAAAAPDKDAADTSWLLFITLAAGRVVSFPYGGPTPSADATAAWAYKYLVDNFAFGAVVSASLRRRSAGETVTVMEWTWDPRLAALVLRPDTVAAIPGLVGDRVDWFLDNYRAATAAGVVAKVLSVRGAKSELHDIVVNDPRGFSYTVGKVAV